MSSLVAPSLSDRIMRSFPAGSHGIPALLRIAAIVETRAVPTAAVTCTAEPVLCINPDFVRQHAGTAEKLLMLVMHELHHVLLGHTRLFRRVTALENIAFDAVINAMLCGMFPEEEHVSFFTDFYDDAAIPACFLRPAPGWSPCAPAPLPPRALRGAVRGSEALGYRLAGLHAALYSPKGVGYDELIEALREATGGDFESLELLGDHDSEEGGASSAGGLEHRAPALFETIREIVERWPRPPEPITGRSPHDMLEARRVIVPPPASRTRLAALLRRVAGREGRGRLREMREVATGVLSPLPRASRRGVVLRALGTTSLLHDAETNVRRLVPAGERVHVYLDVSGSIGNLAGPLAAAILACGDRVHPVVHQFSDAVSDVSLERLRRGEVRTTGGTNIECVARHALDHRVRRAVIVTDGYVGKPAAPLASVLRRMKLGVALVPGTSTKTDLEPFADEWTVLDEDTTTP